MRRPIKTRKDLEIASNHFLRRNPGYAIGVTLTELDYLRGWKDDFFGGSLHEQYSIAANLGGFGAFSDGAHGGVYRLFTGAANGSYFFLYLGGGFETLDPDEGWVMGTRMKISSTASLYGDFGAIGPAWNNTILAGIDTGLVANNWYIQSRRAGVRTFIDTGVAADTGWHWHWLEVRTNLIKYFLDGNLIATKTDNVPTISLQPIVKCGSYAAAEKRLDLDTWIVIPRNL